MARAVRIPGLADLLVVSDPDEIKALAQDDRLDRRFSARGPLLNLILTHRIRSLLEVDGIRLPAVAPRHDPRRAARQRELETALLPQPGGRAWADEDEAALARWVGGAGDKVEIGPLVQGIIGRLFEPGYPASPESYAAACLLDRAPRARNPLLLAWWQISGRLMRARRLLARLVNGDPAGVHATGIAMHTLVRAFEAMRQLTAEPGLRSRLSAEAMLASCLVAPVSVLRQATELAVRPAGELRPGTLVVLELEAARARHPGPELALMTESWSRCPAHAWVPALLRAVWARAAALDAKP